ncbi:MAG: hypothetical protein U0802_15175 [Candidatus Binatia bacterium]
MIRIQPTAGRIALATAMAALAALLWAPGARAYPMYDDGSPAHVGCVQCHNGFQSGNGPLHQRHRIEFGVTTCNLCHPSGGGTTPVRTYWSGPGGGYGCAGCHGQDYGETSPNSMQPKSTAYGLRLYHVAQGVTACGTGAAMRRARTGSRIRSRRPTPRTWRRPTTALSTAT